MLTDRAQPPTANDRFKEGNASRTWGAIAIAVLLHFAVLWLWPAATAAPLKAEDPPDIEVVTPEPEIPEPPAPEDIPRPAAPVITVDAPDDVTIPPSVGDEPLRLPPPPVRDEEGSDPLRDYVAYTVAARLINREEVARTARRLYPPHLRDAGIEGTTLLWVRVGVDGSVAEVRVKESSGSEAFDAAALRVAQEMEFRPAMNLDQPVALWVQIPLQFQIR